jgi:hypothetical protein
LKIGSCHGHDRMVVRFTTFFAERSSWDHSSRRKMSRRKGLFFKLHLQILLQTFYYCFTIFIAYYNYYYYYGYLYITSLWVICCHVFLNGCWITQLYQKKLMLYIYTCICTLYAVNILEADNNVLLAGPAPPTSQCDSTNIVINT